MKKWIFFIFLGILIIVALYFLVSGSGSRQPSYTLQTVKRGDIAEKALAVGTIEPEQEIKVKSTIPGIVSEVMFKVGNKVNSGKPLFKISPNPTPVEYVETRRNMEVTEVNLNRLQSDHERKLQLFRDSLIPQSEMDAAAADYEEAKLRYSIAREKFELMEKGRIRMSNREIDSTIKSPIAGIVLSQSVFQGDPVVPLTNFQPGTELCSLADMGNMLFKGTVDEIDVGKIAVDMAADIQLGAFPDSHILGRVERIYPKAKKEGNATLFDIEILISDDDDGDKTLRAGYSATASITVRESKNILIVPERLVLFENGKKYVEVKKGETIDKIEVRTGLSDGLNIEIISGLTENDQVVERPPREIK